MNAFRWFRNQCILYVCLVCFDYGWGLNWAFRVFNRTIDRMFEDGLKE